MYRAIHIVSSTAARHTQPFICAPRKEVGHWRVHTKLVPNVRSCPSSSHPISPPCSLLHDIVSQHGREIRARRDAHDTQQPHCCNRLQYGRQICSLHLSGETRRDGLTRCTRSRSSNLCICARSRLMRCLAATVSHVVMVPLPAPYPTCPVSIRHTNCFLTRQIPEW